MQYEQNSNLSSKFLTEDSLLIARSIKERLAELVIQLGSEDICDESLVREMNYLLKQYEDLIGGEEDYNSLSTPYDNW